MQKIKIRYKLTFTGLICKGNKLIIVFDIHYYEALETNGFKSSVLATCNIYFLQIIKYLDVQKYLFGINGLIAIKILVQKLEISMNNTNNNSSKKKFKNTNDNENKKRGIMGIMG